MHFQTSSLNPFYQTQILLGNMDNKSRNVISVKQTDKQGGLQRQGENITRARIHNASLFFFAFTLSSRRGNYSSDGQSMCPPRGP